MFKRLLLIVALGATFVACSPAGGSSSPNVADPRSRRRAEPGSVTFLSDARPQPTRTPDSYLQVGRHAHC